MFVLIGVRFEVKQHFVYTSTVLLYVVLFSFILLHMLHHYRCATILAMQPADEASHSLWYIYIVDAKTPGYLYFYTDYVCIRHTFRSHVIQHSPLP